MHSVWYFPCFLKDFRIKRQFNMIVASSFEKITIYRPGLLRLSGGRRTRREKSSRVLEWIGRQLSHIFDLGDWWSVSTTNLSKVMIATSILTADGLSNHVLLQANQRKVEYKVCLTIIFTVMADNKFVFLSSF